MSLELRRLPAQRDMPGQEGCLFENGDINRPDHLHGGDRHPGPRRLQTKKNQGTRR